MTAAEFVKRIQGYYSAAYPIGTDGTPSELSRRIVAYLGSKQPRFLDILFEETLRRHPTSFRCLPDLAVFAACEPAAFEALDRPERWAPALDELPLGKEQGAEEMARVLQTLERLAEARTFKPKRSPPAQSTAVQERGGGGDGDTDRQGRIAKRKKLLGVEQWARLTAEAKLREGQTA